MKFNKKYTLDLAEKILKIDSPSGYTRNVIDYLQNEANHLGFKTSITQKGNLIIEVEGKKPEARGVCAHADTLGLMVRSIKSDGKLAVTKVGGPIMSTLDGEYCRIYTREGKVYTGTILSNSPSMHVYKDASTLERNEDTMEVRIDETVKNKEDVEKLGICNGDFIAIEPNFEVTQSGFIKSRFLDDKLSVTILFSVLEHIASSKIKLSHKTYFMITVYEEVGHGGAWIPEGITELLGVDMGCIGTDLACTEYDVSICAKDSSGPYDYQMTSKLIEIAKENKLNHAVDIYPMYGSDVSTALKSSNNIKGALIGPGVHASHGMERSHIQAVEATAKLLFEYLK